MGEMMTADGSGGVVDGKVEMGVDRKDIATACDQNKRNTPRLSQSIFKSQFSPHVSSPAPLPLLSLTAGSIPPHLRRAAIQRRRSSYPPAVTPSSANLFPWVVGGTPGAGGHEFSQPSDSLTGFGNEVTNMETWNGVGGWESLLSFDTDLKPAEVERSTSATTKVPIVKAQNDLAYKTILDSVVDVETVGQVGVVQVLQEIWNRGGGDAVTSRCLWPEIITALFPSSQKPSAQASLALQTLYNLTIRQWEATVFSGLLSSYTSSLTTPVKPPPEDFEQWMNVTPGVEWSSLTNFFGSTGLTPKAGTPARRASGVRGTISTITPDYFDEQHDGGVHGLDDLLTMMEDEKHERALEAANMASTSRVSSPSPPETRVESFQLPTPPTDSISPAGSASNSFKSKRKTMDRRDTGYSPQSMASPYVTASSTASNSNSTYSISAISQSLDLNRSISLPPVPENEVRSSIKPILTTRPTKVEMPTVSFVPPPPMCMFFSPAFKDLQKGKVGIWKGDLEVRGRGGGKFNILIVGEEESGHVWQSNLWPTTISYPPEPAPTISSCTSSMIPVANLAREGYMPVAMGMVLCNDERISEYVAMVQGFHAEGVAFHLPGLTRLPIVFLPAKFDSSDTLQRLGIAFMSKDRNLPPAPTMGLAPPKVNASTTDFAEPASKRRKSRRQSTGSSAVEGGYRKRVSLGGRQGKIDEGDES